MEGTPILELATVRRLKVEKKFRKIKIRRNLSQKILPKIFSLKFNIRPKKFSQNVVSKCCPKIVVPKIDLEIALKIVLISTLNMHWRRTLWTAPYQRKN